MSHWVPQFELMTSHNNFNKGTLKSKSQYLVCPPLALVHLVQRRRIDNILF